MSILLCLAFAVFAYYYPIIALVWLCIGLALALTVGPVLARIGEEFDDHG